MKAEEILEKIDEILKRPAKYERLGEDYAYRIGCIESYMKEYSKPGKDKTNLK